MDTGNIILANSIIMKRDVMIKLKFLSFLLLAFTYFLAGCSDENPDDRNDEMEPTSEMTTCSENSFSIVVETPNISFEQDSSWLTFNDGPTIVGERLGYLGWDYPGWMGSSDLVFEYPNDGLQIGKYEIVSAGAVLDFDGTGGIMLVCPCDSFVLEILHLDKVEGYCCGTILGKATNQNNELVDIEGSFKAFLDGE